MIAYLRGILLDRGSETVVVDVNGVGYLVTPAASVWRSLPALGIEVRLHIYTHVTQDGPMQLFGFADVQEQRLFETLISVQGVGPKVGLAILSGLAVSELVRAIAGSDVGRLVQIKGIGRKTAERLCVELRDKINVSGAWGAGGVALPPVAAGAPGGRLGEVYAALLTLGFRPAEFDAVVRSLDSTLPAADLVKQALAALRKR